MKLYGEMHRFLPAIASEQGVAIKEVEVNHRARKYGESKIAGFRAPCASSSIWSPSSFS